MKNGTYEKPKIWFVDLLEALKDAPDVRNETEDVLEAFISEMKKELKQSDLSQSDIDLISHDILAVMNALDIVKFYKRLCTGGLRDNR